MRPAQAHFDVAAGRRAAVQPAPGAASFFSHKTVCGRVSWSWPDISHFLFDYKDDSMHALPHASFPIRLPLSSSLRLLPFLSCLIPSHFQRRRQTFLYLFLSCPPVMHAFTLFPCQKSTENLKNGTMSPNSHWDGRRKAIHAVTH
jgi:hypothetical protein